MDETSDLRMIERVITIPADHPCLPGHFPGRPIVPAVIILDAVRAIMEDRHPTASLVAIDHCKFQDFVLPDQPFKVRLTVSDGSIFDFTCRAADDDRLLAKGRFRIGSFEAAETAA